MTWTTDESSIKVVEVKTFVDKNPTLYKKRAKAFAEQGSFSQSLKEYDTAIKYSENSVFCCLSKLFFCLGNNQIGAAIATLFKTIWVIVWHKLRPFWFWPLLIGFSLMGLEKIGLDFGLLGPPFESVVSFFIAADFINVVSKSFKLNRGKYTIHFLGAMTILLGANWFLNKVYIPFVWNHPFGFSDLGDILFVIIQIGAMIYMGVVAIKMLIDIVKYLSTKGNRLYIDEG